jgi:hypothetical protein
MPRSYTRSYKLLKLRVLLHAVIPWQSVVQIHSFEESVETKLILLLQLLYQTFRHTGTALWISFIFFTLCLSRLIYSLFSPWPLIFTFSPSFTSIFFLQPPLPHEALSHFISFLLFTAYQLTEFTETLYRLRESLSFRGKREQKTTCVWQFENATAFLLILMTDVSKISKLYALKEEYLKLWTFNKVNYSLAKKKTFIFRAVKKKSKAISVTGLGSL